MSKLGLSLLVFREIRYRLWQFFFAVFAVAIATGGVVGMISLFQIYDAATTRSLAEKEKEIRTRLAELSESMRKGSLIQQFNITILSAEQDLASFHFDHYPNTTLPESDVKTLVNSDITTINHLEPSLTKRIRWPEKNCDILLTGIRGEAPLLLASPKKMFNPPVPPGQVALGSELAGSLAPGDPIEMFGKTYKIARVHWPKGTIADMTAWLDLDEAQKILDSPGVINAMRAIHCGCANMDLDLVAKKIKSILPDTQVIIDKPKADTRNSMRSAAEEESREALATEAASRAETLTRITSTAFAVLPILLATCGGWLLWLSWFAVRSRRQEIAVLRSMGASSIFIAALFLSRAAAAGLAGALSGCAIAVLLAVTWGTRYTPGFLASDAILPLWIFSAALAGIAFSLAAALIPAIAATRQDPAKILQQEI